MEHCEACAFKRKQDRHRVEIRKWITARKVKVHAQYSQDIGLLNDAYSRPHKFTLEQLEWEIGDK